MPKSIFLFVLFFLTAWCSLAAQTRLSGKITDAVSGDPVPFALVYDSLSNSGTTSDLDGKFSLVVPKLPCVLHVRCTGYQAWQMRLPVTQNIPLHIQLAPAEYELHAVAIHAGQNPALYIIRKTSAARKIHDPENLPSYTCTSYTKTFVTVENPHDTVQDTVPQNRIDSLLAEQYLFLSEAVSTIKWKKPGHKEETVIASRISGMKNPSFSLLSTELQSFSFYSNTFDLFTNRYISPLDPSAFGRYNYTLTDSLFEANDTVFIIRFAPKPGSSFNGMKGELHISSDGYAIRDVSAEPAHREGTLAVKIQQRYARVDSTHWFPVQLVTQWYNNLLLVQDSTMTVNSEPNGETDSTARLTKFVCKSYLSDIHIGVALRGRDFSDDALDFQHRADDNDTAFWKQYRVEPLTQKEKNTYHMIDSLGKAEHFQRRMNFYAAIASGYILAGPFNIDLNRVLQYNNYEGIRLGFGVHTNDRISKRFSVGGYGGYGFRDKEFSYGSDAALYLWKAHDLRLYGSWQHDLVESGGIAFRLDDKFRGSEAYRPLFVEKLDDIDKTEGGIRFRAFHNFTFDFFFNYQLRSSNDAYHFVIHKPGLELFIPAFAFDETGMSFRYAPGERYGEVLGIRALLKPTTRPIIWGELAEGFNGLTYKRAELRVSEDFGRTIAGEPSFTLLAGQVWGDVPYSLLYAGRGTFAQYSVSVRNTFETMRVNEFLSNRYAAFFFAHTITLQIGKHYRPQVVLRSSAAVGSLAHPESHSGVAFTTMEKGYYESGIELNRLVVWGFGGYGISAFWRYGPYALPKKADNLALKFTLGFVF